jgi:hypothetical protein
MGKIIINQTSKNQIGIKLPAELQNYIYQNKKTRWIYFQIGNDINNENNKIIIIKNYYNYCGHHNREIRNITGSYVRCGRRTQVLNTHSYSMSSSCSKISSVYTHNNINSVCNTYYLDYNIYEEDNGNYCIIAKFNVPKYININSNNISEFSDISYQVIERGFYTNTVKSDALEEFYHYVSFENDEFTYFTKAKYSQGMIKMINEGYANDYASNHINVYCSNLTRKTSLTKFLMKSFDNVDEKVIQAHLEYNKMLSTYNPELFSIVTGNDIVKYYNVDNYFKKSGDLGSSCMRNDAHQHQIEFYAKNNNVSLIVMRPEGTDGIIGRALLWTTVDGIRVMDRIYTNDIKLVSLFHRYAADNNIVNIYKYRIPDVDNPSFTAMSPGNWKTKYKRNFIVDLNYLTKKIQKLDLTEQFNLSKTRQTSINSIYDIPYLDNFTLINTITNQISVLPIENVFMCPLSNQPINSDNVLYINGVIYNGDFVYSTNGVAELRPDIVTLDDDVVNSVIKTEMEDFIESLSEEETWYEGDDNDDDEWTEEEPEEEEVLTEITMTNNNNNEV